MAEKIGREPEMKVSLPRLAMVTLGIRRDVLAPLRFLTGIELRHFYRDTAYGDLTPEDLDDSLLPFTSPLDLYRKLVAARPAFTQTVEPFSIYTQPYMWACYFAARKTCAQLIVPAFENRPLAIKFGQVRGGILRRMLGIFFKRTARIIVLNNGAYSNAVGCGAQPAQIRRALWGVWGVDTQEFVPRSMPRQDDAHVILFAGRLHPEKGIFVLLEAFPQVQEQFPAARLWIAGDGPARADVAEWISRHHLEKNVSLLGMVKHRSMPQLLQQSGLVCVPSLTTRKWAEQVGSTLLQAMACGIPIVSTRSGAIPEYVPDGKAGLLVQENNSRALAAGLTELLRDPGRAQAMGEYGRTLALERYDARANVLRAQEILLETL